MEGLFFIVSSFAESGIAQRDYSLRPVLDAQLYRLTTTQRGVVPSSPDSSS